MDRCWTELKDKRTWCFQFLCIVAESKETEFGAERSERQRNKEKGKGDSWSHTACQKSRSGRHTCDILASQTCRHRHRKLVLPSFCCLCSQHCSLPEELTPSAPPAAKLLWASKAQDLTSSVLSLLTMHSTVPIPKMTGCVDLNMFHIVSASFCINKKLLEPFEHNALCGGGTNVWASSLDSVCTAYMC